MKSAYTELALYGSQNVCSKTDNIVSPISEFSDGTVSLVYEDLFIYLVIYFIYNSRWSRLGDYYFFHVKVLA